MRHGRCSCRDDCCVQSSNEKRELDGLAHGTGLAERKIGRTLITYKQRCENSKHPNFTSRFAIACKQSLSIWRFCCLVKNLFRRGVRAWKVGGGALGRSVHFNIGLHVLVCVSWLSV